MGAERQSEQTMLVHIAGYKAAGEWRQTEITLYVDIGGCRGDCLCDSSRYCLCTCISLSCGTPSIRHLYQISGILEVEFNLHFMIASQQAVKYSELQEKI